MIVCYIILAVKMGSDHNLKTWVSDKLMSLVGFSQPTVVQYVIGLSKQAVSAADVQTKLEEFGCSSSTETRTFAQELFARVPRKAAGLNVSYYLFSFFFSLFLSILVSWQVAETLLSNFIPPAE